MSGPVADTMASAGRLVVHWAASGRLQISIAGRLADPSLDCLVETLAGDPLRRVALRPAGRRRMTGTTEIPPAYGAIWVAVQGLKGLGVVAVAPPTPGQYPCDGVWS
jgi:hypothetical protein